MPSRPPVVVAEFPNEVVVRGDLIRVLTAGPQGPAGTNGHGVPAGGATGQVLEKVSDADYATDWADATGGGVSSFNTRTGDVALTEADVDAAFSPAANFVYAGPASGGAAAPSFRALVAADVPDLSGTYQSLDADLTALAALSGTNTIYYRSAANTWSAVTISSSLGFTAGTLGSALGTAATQASTVFDAAGAATSALATAEAYTDAQLSGYVPTSRTVNGHALSGNVTVSKSDVGLPHVLDTSTANTLAGYDGSGNFAGVAVGSGLSLSGGTLTSTGSGGSVTAVSVVTANGLAGTVANATSTPAITLTTTVTGVLKGNGTAISAAAAGTDYVAPSTTVNGHPLSANVTVTASDVGLGSVTNDAQTKAAVVPNTAPSAGQVLVGNAGGTAYAPVTLSGSGATFTLSSAGVLTVSAIANASLVNSSVTISGHVLALGGSLSLAATDISYSDANTGLGATNVQAAIDDLNAVVATGNNANAQGTWLVSGGGISWVAGYTFDVAPAQYYISGIAHTSAATQLTLGAPDGTFNRFDALVVTATGTVAVIAGTPSSTPALPDLDPQAYLALTYVRVDTGTTAPPAVSSVVIYAENAGSPTEWTGSTSGSGIVLGSTNNPHLGTKDVEGTSVANGSYFEFVAAAPLDVTAKTNLVFYVRSKASWGKKSFVISFRTSAGQVGSTVALADGFFGFSSSNTTTYQTIVIPISQFAIAAGTNADRVRFLISGASASIGFYVDDISLQGGTGGGATAGITQAQGDARYLKQAANLSDLTSASTARTNLGLVTTAHALSVGAGTSAPTALAVGPTGTVLIGTTGADPSFSGGPQLFPPASGGAQSLIGQGVSTDVGVFVNPAASITSGDRYYTMAIQATAAQVGGSTTGHVVPFYAAVESNTAGAFIWSNNSLVQIDSGMTSGTAQGYELDVNNKGAASLTPASALKVYGFTVSGATGAGTFRCSSPFSVQGALWNYGLTFYNDSLSGGQAYIHSADATYPAYGVNFSGAAFGTAAIQLQHGQWATDGSKLGVGVNPTDAFEVQASNSGTISLGDFRNSSTATTAQALISVQLGSDTGTGTTRGLALGVRAETTAGPTSYLTDFEPGRDLTFGTTTSGGSNLLRLTLDHLGNAVIGSAAVATNATDGFFYLDSCAGTPTGTPTAYTGRVPLVYDSTNNLLYAYNSSWHNLSGGGGGTVTSVGGSGGTTGLTLTGGAITTSGTLTLGGTLVAANGGTGLATLTAHSLQVGNGTGTMTQLGAATNGQIPIGSTGADPVLATITPGAGITVTNTAGGIAIAASGTGGAVASVNYAFNAGMWFAQRQAPGTLTTITTETYGPDRFRCCRENTDLQYSRTDTNGSQESGLQSRYYGNFKKITSTGKFLVFQPLEGSETYDLAGQTVTLQVLMKASSAKTIRLGAFQLNSSGTMDTLTATTASAWGANSTDPTLGTNEAYITGGLAVPAGANGTVSGNAVSCSVTTSWQLFAVSFTVPATAKNLCLAVWSDSQFSANDILSVSQWGLFLSSLVQSWQPGPRQAELARCQRYYEKSFDVDTVPGTAAAFDEWLISSGNGQRSFIFKTAKFISPTMTAYSPTTGTSGKFRDFTGSADVTAGSDGACTTLWSVFLTATAGHVIRANWTAESEL